MEEGGSAFFKGGLGKRLQKVVLLKKVYYGELLFQVQRNLLDLVVPQLR